MERQLEKILVKFKGRFYVGPSQANGNLAR
jgi:hypothetical protein